MTLLGVVTGALSVCTFLVFAYAYLRRRHVFVKPSIWVLFFLHLFIQVPSTVAYPYIFHFLPDPWEFALLLHGFVATGVLVSVFFGTRAARITWERITSRRVFRVETTGRLTVVLALLVAVTLGRYLSSVPLEETGLYAIVTNPAFATAAREESLKLLTDPVTRYGYALLMSCFAPLLAGFLGFRLLQDRGRFDAAISVGVILLLTLAVTLSGSRAPSVKLLLGVVLVWMFHRRLRLRLGWLLLLGITFISLPTLLTLLREGRAITWSLFADYFVDIVAGRVFWTPTEVASWYAHYAQTHSDPGLMGITRLARLVGEDGTNFGNRIGLLYSESTVVTIQANSSFLFSHYIYFGLISLPFSLLGLWLIDLASLVYARLSDSVLLPTVATMSVAATAFGRTEFTTVFLTHGFGVLLLTALALTFLGRLRVSKISLGFRAGD